MKSLPPECRTGPDPGAPWEPAPPLAEGAPDHPPPSRAAWSSPEKNLLSQRRGLSCSPLFQLRERGGKEGAPGQRPTQSGASNKVISAPPRREEGGSDQQRGKSHFFLFFKIYFIDYAITVVPIFPSLQKSFASFSLVNGVLREEGNTTMFGFLFFFKLGSNTYDIKFTI